MGYFGTWTYSNAAWVEGGPSSDDSLSIEIHERDIATIRFGPTSSTVAGCLYLGIHPSDDFGDESAGMDVDVGREAEALAIWAEHAGGSRPNAESVATLVVRKGGDDEPTSDFVEEAVHALIAEIGIPDPPGMPLG